VILTPMTRPEPEPVTVPTDAGAMPAHLWHPASGSGPGLVVLQEIFGVSGYIRRRAADLAEAGYVVLAPELYWRLGAGPVDESAPGAIEEAMGRAQKLDWSTTVADAVAALGALRGRDEVVGGTGVVGFCFGGGLGFNVAAVDAPDVLVSYYGSAIPGLLDLAPQVTAPSLHHFGTADDYIDGPTVERIRAAVTAGDATVEFETYEGANHAFDNSDFLLHHPAASALAWERTLAFLARELPVA
jgi:carboxymethylenebutenolidase